METLHVNRQRQYIHVIGHYVHQLTFFFLHAKDEFYASLRKLVHAIYIDFLTVKIENFIGKILIFLIFLLKTYIVGTR